MEVTKTLKPGDRGTARLLREYGDRLVCVRYRFDSERTKHLTTVEIIVDERDAIEEHISSSNKTRTSQESVVVRIDFHETELREKAKQAKGIWDPRAEGLDSPVLDGTTIGLAGTYHLGICSYM